MRRLLVPLVAAAVLVAPATAFANPNCPQAVRDVRGSYVIPSRVDAELNRAAAVHGVPARVLRAIAYVESGWRQFKDDGSPLLSTDSVCGIGIMQVTADGTYSDEDKVRLASDYVYNIDRGAKTLRDKWDLSQSTAPPAGGTADDPDVIENWYYAIYLYNGDGGGTEYPDKVVRVLLDPFRYAPNFPLLRPYWFTRPQDAKPDYVFPSAFQAQYSPVRQFVYYDHNTGAVTDTRAAATHSLAATSAPNTTYPAGLTGPDAGARVTCAQCGGWRLAQNVGTVGRAHWTNTVTGAAQSRINWHPSRDGRYRVAAYVPALPGQTLGTATYTTQGVTKTVDQQAYAGKWVPLGDHSLADVSSVELTDASAVAGQPVIADAVRFSALPSVTVDTPSPDVGYGARVSVTARLWHSGAGVPGKAMRFYRRPFGTTTWRYVATKTTDSRGIAVLSATATQNYEYWAKFVAPDAGWVSKNGNVQPIKVRSLLSLVPSRTEAPRGTRVTMKVTVRSAHTGYRVRLYRGDGWTYSHLASATLSSTGTATFTVSRSTAGGWQYYAMLPGHTDHSTGWSKYVNVRWT